MLNLSERAITELPPLDWLTELHPDLKAPWISLLERRGCVIWR